MAPLCPAPSNHQPIFYHYGFAYSRHFTSMGSYNTQSCVSGFLHQHVFKVHPCCSMCQNLTPFCGWITSCVERTHSVYPSVCLLMDTRDCEQCCWEPFCMWFCLSPSCHFAVACSLLVWGLCEFPGPDLCLRGHKWGGKSTLYWGGESWVPVWLSH